MSSGEDDDGLLDEDIPGEEDDNLLDDAELDYTEDILEETDEKHVIKNDEPESQDAVSIYLDCVIHTHTHVHT